MFFLIAQALYVWQLMMKKLRHYVFSYLNYFKNRLELCLFAPTQLVEKQKVGLLLLMNMHCFLESQKTQFLAVSPRIKKH